MIVVDSSAIVAIALDEPEAATFLHIMIGNPTVIGAPTLLESRMVLAGRGVRDPLDAIAIILDASQTEVVAFDPALADQAFSAFLRFGKGRHAVALNYGDCMAYALAQSLNVPLLFKGSDFTLTDLVSAIS